ncbi:MFS transporter [Methylobacterium nodulans]|uniref:Major facilitator superfamily MFS_1 n=1 Tax=Methylobacterium nodulans (strain LMG 21967 / CNCM I-2342 / ORS 2060) TaxID=460265 RepID=B8IC34_METNO|nr:MFS transporter [Methylobacterium nodulans]ACL61216.1 major facilitator superfamily MFS_1 [Methylobacterium nodulans ORS 2060]
MALKPLIGLLGVLVAALNAQFNELVMAAALADVRGAFGISHDPGLWIGSVYASGVVFGMALGPWLAVTFTLRRFTLFAIGLVCGTTLLIPFAPDLSVMLGLRLFQGLGGGFTIPLLMMTALRVLTPPIRLYGLAIYALTATFSPAISSSIAALWTDIVDWRFVFFEALPLGALAAVLVWHGLPQDHSRYERLHQFDWRGALLLAIGAGTLTTLMYHGDHKDWFNSEEVWVLVLLCAVTFALLALNEWHHPLPVLKLQLLKQRNFAYGVLGLFLFVVLSLSSSLVPQTYLVEIQGYRALQGHWITLLIALGQFLMLPAVAFLLDHRWADARIVTLFGLALIGMACLGNAALDASWNREQFYLWQALQAVGQPMVVLPLLMMATNTVKGPEEGPFASALVNATRSLAAPVGIGILEFIERWRGALHSERLVEQVGQTRFQPMFAPNSLLPGSSPAVSEQGERLARAVVAQANVLTAADTFLILAAFGVALALLVVLLPVRTYPPRILFARG